MQHEDITSPPEPESTPGSLFIPREKPVVKPDWVVAAEANTDPKGVEVQWDRTEGEDSPPAGRRRVLYAAGAGALAIGVAATALAISLNAQRQPPPAVAEDKGPLGGPTVKNSEPWASEPVTPSATPAIPVPFPDYPVEVSEVKGRITDRNGGLSLVKLGGPWKQSRVPKSMIQMGFHQRQEVLTETNTKTGEKWHAFAVSGHHPLSAKRQSDTKKIAGDLLSAIIKGCYPKARRSERLVNRAIKKGWMAGARVPYEYPGLRATSSTVIAVAMDTGRERPAIFVASVPDTHKDLYGDLNQLVTSLKASG